MATKGFIKYRCDWEKTNAVSPEAVVDINRYRNALYKLNLIREDTDGTGVGNLSIRIESLTPNKTPRFIISGSQTGKLPIVTEADYSVVTDFDAEQNHLVCEGIRKASSESLTHGVIYSSDSSVGAVIHVHDSQMWKGLLDQVPATRPEIAYGTPEMAEETRRLFIDTQLSQFKIFAMAGHEDGIVAFGEDLETAYCVLIDWGLRTGLFNQAEAQGAIDLPK